CSVAVYFPVEAAADLPQFSVTFTGDDVASGSASLANGRRDRHIPFARIMFFQGLIGKNTSGANFGEISTEFILQYPLFGPAEINMVMSAHGVQIGAAGVVLVKTDAAVTMDAAVHFVVQERPEVLVLVGAFVKAELPVVMPGHNGHILKVARPAFIADGAVVGVIRHEPFDDAGPEPGRIRVADGDPGAVAHR